MTSLIKYGSDDRGTEFDLDIDVTNLPSRREAFMEISRPVAKAQERAKHVPPEMVVKAIDNEPFDDYARAIYAWKRMYEKGGGAKDRFNQSYILAVEKFLRRTYHNLTSIPGISFDIGDISEERERRAVDEALARYRSANMQGQVRSIEEAYDGLRALRLVFKSAMQRDCFSLETVVPSRYLPELLVAAPVWFVEPKEKPAQKTGGATSTIVRDFCDLGGTDEFANLFQMYNVIPRYFDEFEGRDIMPFSIAELTSQVRGLFDYLVIATPYHDMASRSWQEMRQENWRGPPIGSSAWIRNIDPFLFGFLKQIPELMFFLGRWSGTGLFPLIGDMIADTIEHIRKNKDIFISLNPRGWYKEDRIEGVPFSFYFWRHEMPVGKLFARSDFQRLDRIQSLEERWEEWVRRNHPLVKVAEGTLQHFKDSNLDRRAKGSAARPDSRPLGRRSQALSRRQEGPAVP